MLCHVARLYEHILESRALVIIEPQLEEEQYGYRREGHIRPNICITDGDRKVLGIQKTLYVTFIDLEKAFESMLGYLLWKCLDEVYGVEGRLIAAIQSTYNP